MVIRCAVPGCEDVALMLHATGCNRGACGEHAYPGQTCPCCHEPYEVAA